MKRILLTTTTAAALIAGPALAESTASTPIDTDELNAQAENLPAGTKPMIDVAGKAFFNDENYKPVPAQDITMALVDGSIVYDNNETWVGELDTIMVDQNDTVVGAIIDVGGFLGIGEKEVAIAIEDMTVLHNEYDNKTKVLINATEDELEEMPAYEA